MLDHYNEVQNKAKNVAREIADTLDGNKYHQKAIKKISRVIKKTVKIEGRSSETLFYNEKNKVLFEYKYQNLGYSSPLPIAKCYSLILYFATTFEKKLGYTFEPDDDIELCEWFVQIERILELCDIPQEEVSELDYIPEDCYKQQLHSFFNECFGADESLTLLRVDNSQ